MHVVDWMKEKKKKEPKYNPFYLRHMQIYKYAYIYKAGSDA